MSTGYLTSSPQPVNPQTKPGVRQALDNLSNTIDSIGSEIVTLQSKTLSFRVPLKLGEGPLKEAPTPVMSDVEAYIMSLYQKLSGHLSALCATTDSVRD